MKWYKNNSYLIDDEEAHFVGEQGTFMSKKCLYCYELLPNNSSDFHEACNKKFFGTLETPLLGYSKYNLDELATQIIQTQTVVTGVQAKISLSIKRKQSDKAAKLTLVGLYGDYILKPPSEYYPFLPEVEDVTMRLAEVCGLQKVPHTLVHLQDGTLCYLTKRIDRIKNHKLHMEDMCQLTERHTEDKYKGSHEQIAKVLMKFSANPILDVSNFYELVLFSFLTGNADMHLKNFSMIHKLGMGYQLAPAYDLLATALVNPSDTEELALNLNGKKRKLNYKDFLKAYENSGLTKKLLDRTLENFQSCMPHMIKKLKKSFLNDEYKNKYEMLLKERMDSLKG
jgi:serine/threonine-protein kinase HipA